MMKEGKKGNNDNSRKAGREWKQAKESENGDKDLRLNGSMEEELPAIRPTLGMEGRDRRVVANLEVELTQVPVRGVTGWAPARRLS